MEFTEHEIERQRQTNILHDLEVKRQEIESDLGDVGSMQARIAKMEEALDKINSRCDEYACGNCAEVKLIVQQALEGEYDN